MVAGGAQSSSTYPAFLRNPEYANRIWAFYNRRLRDFYVKHADRCLLVNLAIDQIVHRRNG